MTEAAASAELPSTIAFIGYHAAQRPDDIAVTEDGQAITYAGFYRDIGRITAALRSQGLGPGMVVGIECPQFYRHWLCVLALEALGAASFSYDPDEAAPMAAALAGADCILCSPVAELPQARRVLVMDPNWWASVEATAPESPVETAPIHGDTPMRIVQSSGTTGSLKRMVHSGRVRAFWLQQYQFRTGFNRQSRYLVAMGFRVEAFHVYATACIRAGGTCFHDNRDTIATALGRHAITHVTFPPFLLLQVLEEVRGDFAKPSNLTIFTIGAPVSATVRARVRQLLAGELVESYGTQEIAAICTMAEDGVGTVLPGVRVETVDDNDRSVCNAPGRVRILSDGSVGGYIDNPGATREMFRDGWFYPGDLAVMQDRRRLQLVGRADDLFNIQGIKFAPGPLEEKLRTGLPVDDLCLTVLPDTTGANRLWIVVVLPDPEQLAAIRDAVVPKLPAVYGTVFFIAVRQIPRTITGKVRRKMLNDALLQAQPPAA